MAILDIDMHHGNGTQQIFYERSDVLTISIHGDPSNFYPFYTGFEKEIGDYEGEGANLKKAITNWHYGSSLPESSKHCWE